MSVPSISRPLYLNGDHMTALFIPSEGLCDSGYQVAGRYSVHDTFDSVVFVFFCFGGIDDSITKR